MMKRMLIVAAALLLACVYAQKTPCSWNIGGNTFDFSALKKTSSAFYSPYTGRGAANGISYTYHWNFCAPAYYPNPPCGIYGDSSDMVAYQVKDDDQSCTPLGRLTDAPTFELGKNGVVLTYVNNIDMCRSNTIPRRARFAITCDLSVEWVTVGSVDEDNATVCQYDFNARSKYACTQNKPNNTCSWQVGSQLFDFSALKKSSSFLYKPFTGTGIDGGISFNYGWNFCAPVFYSGSVCGNNGDSSDMVAFQIKADDGSCTPIGRLADPPTFQSNANGVVLTYINNVDVCRSGTVARKIQFTITCDTSVEWETIGSVSEDYDVICKYDVTARSLYACPVQNKMSLV